MIKVYAVASLKKFICNMGHIQELNTNGIKFLYVSHITFLSLKIELKIHALCIASSSLLTKI